MTNDGGCDGELPIARKQCRDEEGTTTDRLSHLPQPIIHHILSFLDDTKLVVQISKLSRDWNHAWKHVSVLNLRRSSFQSARKFDRFVSKVLSLRCDLNLRKVVYSDPCLGRGRPCNEERAMDRLVKVVNYALSHDVEQLVVHRYSKRVRNCKCSLIFSEYCINDNNSDNGKKEKEKKKTNLKVLYLDWITLDHGFVSSSGFPLLTTLNVTLCKLDPEGQVLSTNFPCLKNLAMTNCFTDSRFLRRRIKVSGPHLLSLKLKGMEHYDIEICAPQLKFLALSQSMGSKGFFYSVLPALDRVDIALLTWGVSRLNKSTAGQYLNSLFQSLHCAKNLTLAGSTIQILNNMCEILEQQRSPFKRLETLILPSNDLHCKVIDYFFKSSSCDKPNILFNLELVDQ